MIIVQYRPPVEAFCVEFPAGLIDEGESPADAAVREIFEETGYHAELEGLIGVDSHVIPAHRRSDPDAGPLIAVRLSIITRKTLGGLETDLSGRVLRPGGEVFPGLYAAGEVAGFGGGGMHGYRSLEGTFLGGCLFSGRTAGRAVAVAL